jgi:hypothetical protein
VAGRDHCIACGPACEVQGEVRLSLSRHKPATRLLQNRDFTFRQAFRCSGIRKLHIPNGRTHDAKTQCLCGCGQAVIEGVF